MLYIIFFIILILIIIYAFTRTKRTILQTKPTLLHKTLERNVLFYKKLTNEHQKVFRKRIHLFLKEIYIEGVKTEISELDKILIAASAVIPVFGFKDWHYNNLTGVLLYPDTFNEELQFEKDAEGKQILGMVGTGKYENQMILSKKALYHGFHNKTDKSNTAIHEFVHLIDKTDGITDGIPERLIKHQYTIPWLNLMHQEMEAIDNNISDIRKYGGTNQQEFFAVASEYFFERPDLLKHKHPQLYKMLEDCFQTQNYIT